jgi:hypothetical protein
MNYENFVKKCVTEVKEKFTSEQEIEIYNFLVRKVDEPENNGLLETDGEDIDPMEELMIDVINEAFPG